MVEKSTLTYTSKTYFIKIPNYQNELHYEWVQGSSIRDVPTNVGVCIEHVPHIIIRYSKSSDLNFYIC